MISLYVIFYLTYYYFLLVLLSSAPKPLLPTVIMFLKYFLFLPLLYGLLNTAPANAQTPWGKDMPAPFAREYIAVRSGPAGKELFLLTSQGLFKQPDTEKKWEKIFSSPPGQDLIEFYAHKNQDYYLLGNNTLWLSKDRGQSWKKIFRLSGRKNFLSALAIHPQDPEILYLLCGSKLYLSLDQGESWQQETPSLSRDYKKIYFHPRASETLFLISEDAVFKSLDFGKSYFPLLRLRQSESEEMLLETDVSTENEENAGQEIPPPVLRFSPENPKHALFSDGKNLFSSNDSGQTWAQIPQSILPGDAIHDLLWADANRVFISTSAGLLEMAFNKASFKKVSQGLENQEMKALALLQKENPLLIAAGAHQLFSYPLISPEAVPLSPLAQSETPDIENLRRHLAKEPGIQELHQAAIRYNDISQSKINRWHWLSRLKAFFPSFSVGKDLSASESIDIDRGGTNTPDFYISGPRSRSWDMDFNLSWDIADLLWSSDHTSIDSRSRYTVELREEILNEVTRLYFERKRALIQLYLEPPQDLKERAELLLHIDELTAYLDSLTGGYLSARLNKKNGGMPAF